jgi:TonB-linked SusC/RagA family outer membrane protein
VGLKTLSAQTRTVSGKISDEEGVPIPGASIVVKGTTIGTVSSPDGTYSLNIPDDAVFLVFSFVGMKSQEVSIEGKTSINVVLSANFIDVDEVVVTALGISREKKALGYAVQEISGEDLTKAKDQNVVNSLSGKISGVQVTSASGAVGSSSRITIRGNSSFTNNQPLFVVDGVPISNYNSDVDPNGGVDYGNGASDINPDNIESITVLKGANAAALYGMQAGNGVILITTKSAKKSGGVKVSFNTGFTMSDAYIIPHYQNLYGQGSNGSEYEYNVSGISQSYQDWAAENSFTYVDGLGGGVNDNKDKSWGPRMDIGLKLAQFDSPVVNGEYQPTDWVSHPDNVKDFFQTGYTFDNSLSIEGASGNMTNRLFISRQSITGTIPNTELKKTTGSINSTISLNDRFTAKGTVTYTQSKSDNIPGQGYDENNIMQSLGGWIGRQVNLKSLKNNWKAYNKDGNPYNWMSTFHNNPYWTVYNNTNSMLRDHVYGNMSLDFKIADWLSVMGRSGIDWYQLTNKRVNYDGSYGVQAGGSFAETKTYGREFNADLLVTYNKKITSNFGVNGTVGANYRDYYKNYSKLNANSLTVPNLFNINNVSGTVGGDQELTQLRSNSVFGSMSLSYKDYLFVDITARNDWSSTLDEDFFYPSATASLLLTQAFPIQSAVLSYAKLRAGWAKVGNATDAYKTNNVYTAEDPYNGVAPYHLALICPPTRLSPEKVISKEVGADLKLFDYRLGLSATYYDKITRNQIMDIDISDAAGYNKMTINAGEIENSGVELQLTGQILKSTRGLNWEMSVNWAKNRNRVNKLYEDIDSYLISDSWNALTIEAIPGKAFGVIKGYDYVRNADGKVIVNDKGLPIAGDSPTEIGRIMPDWTGGINNSFRWKNLSAGFLIDMRMGGDIFSVTNWFGAQSGVSTETVQNASRPDVEKGANIREVGIVVGKDVLKTNGAVDEDGNENNMVVSAQEYFENYWNIEKEGIVDGSFIKLREITLGYSFSSKILAKTGFIKTANLSFVGRNVALLWTHKSNTMRIDPETALGTTDAGMGIEQYQLPATRNLGFKLSLTF